MNKKKELFLDCRLYDHKDTDDLGVLHKGCECGCGIITPYFDIIGRVGLKDIKTCAATANELLGGSVK